MLCKAYLAVFTYFCLSIMSAAVEPQAQVPLSLNDQDKAGILAEIQSKHNLAHTLGRQGEAAEAEALLRAILDTQLNTLALSNDDDDVLTTKNNLAAQLGHQDKYEEAEAMHREVLAANIRVHGPDNEHNIVFLNNLAGLLEGTGRVDASIAMHMEAVDLANRIWGPSDPHESGLIVMNNAANQYADKGDYVPAEKLLREAIRGYKILHDKGHKSEEEGDHVLHGLRVKARLASVLVQTNRPEEAAEVLQEVVQGLQGEQNPWLKGRALADLGSVYAQLGRWGDAEEAMRKGLGLVMNCKRRDEGWLKRKVDDFKKVLRELGKAEEARDFDVEKLAEK